MNVFVPVIDCCTREISGWEPAPTGSPVTAAQLEALGAILTPEQMAIYLQVGNPFVARGPGS